MDQIRPYRFPFETYDDFEMSQELSLLIRNRFIKNHTTTLNLSSLLKHYLINTQKDHISADIGLRQSFGRWAIKLGYEIVPHYLIRYYRNPAGANTDYRACRVDYHKGTGKVSIFPNNKMSIHVIYAYMIEKYHDPFSIYNANDNIASIQYDQEILPHLDLRLTYSFRASRRDTAGIEAVEETPDASYDQHNPGFTMVYLQKMLLPVELSIGYQYKFRNFLSNYPDDIFHYSRQDHLHDIRTSIRVRLHTGIKVECAYEETWRSVTSNINNSLDEIKNYSQTKVTAALMFYY
jgi:hypothetical protein